MVIINYSWAISYRVAKALLIPGGGGVGGGGRGVEYVNTNN